METTIFMTLWSENRSFLREKWVSVGVMIAAPISHLLVRSSAASLASIGEGTRVERRRRAEASI